ncbi:hypothetical protein M9458_041087, partial [Cirrhinus mrigala]
AEEGSILDHPGPVPQRRQHPDRPRGEDLVSGGGDAAGGAAVQLAEERPGVAQLRADGHHADRPRHLARNHQPGHHRPQVHRLRHLHVRGVAAGRRDPRDQHRRQHLLHH